MFDAADIAYAMPRFSPYAIHAMPGERAMLFFMLAIGKRDENDDGDTLLASMPLPSLFHYAAAPAALCCHCARFDG